MSGSGTQIKSLYYGVHCTITRTFRDTSLLTAVPVVRLVSSALHVGRKVLVASVAFKRKQVKIQSEGADVEALILDVLSLAAGA